MKQINKTKWILRISVLLNFIFLFLWFINRINSPSEELGVLKQDVNVGILGGEKTYFKIPKGITVRNASQRGISAIGQFENNRFEIVITSEREIVDYNVPKSKLESFENYYSADEYPGKGR
ncbi:hypothetical protein [Daejeonia sp. YH14]|uniref:hypothetical protein n=1 Tax=Daejeonia sp. YH14 TaxID=3439042 RepID=UPI003F4944E2